jgi:hypothetical protein
MVPSRTFVIHACALLACTASLGVVHHGSADDINWSGGSGWWNDAAQWDLGRVPAAEDYVYINSSSASNISVQYADAEPPDLGWVYLDNSNTALTTLLVQQDAIVALGFSVGDVGKARIHQNAGDLTAPLGFILGDTGENSVGVYNLFGGSLTGGFREYIGNAGLGLFNQSAGDHVFSGGIYLGHLQTGQGVYNFSGTAEVRCDAMYVGEAGSGDVNVNGGLMNIDFDLVLGVQTGASGTLTLNDGTITVLGDVIVGDEGQGDLLQSGGSLTCQALRIQNQGAAVGTYRIGAGSLQVADVFISRGAPRGTSTSRFAIDAPDATLCITNRLVFGINSNYTASAGAELRMKGSDFENECTNAAALTDLVNTTLVFEGGPDDISMFEAASSDSGTSPDGLSDNFAIGSIILGGDDVGHLKIVDVVDNQQDGPDNEVLYVHAIELGDGSTLDLNGHTVYYESLTEAAGSTIELNGGLLAAIQQPNTCPADVDPYIGPGNWGDGIVGIPDFYAMLQHWGSCPISDDCPWDCASEQAGGVGDGVIDINDFMYLLQHWGPCQP